jgi:3-hydroxyacyl-CoA dehydrogenase/enoyl-CoA hydratase/3-hydroxybutyryl-CoA epimerase
MEAGLAYEREAIGRLAMTPACHNLVNLFFQREKAKKLPAELRSDLVRPVKRVGVVGAGTMGAGIAQLAAVKGFEVVLQEVNKERLSDGLMSVMELFRKAAEARVLSPEDATAKSRLILPTTTWEGFENADLVVEAVIEELDLKRTVFQELERSTKPGAILATNTSSLLVAALQEGREHPERVGGLHFFNPVHKMPLVEVVRGPATDEATIATLTQWAIDLGKTPVVVKDSPGFLVNRILMPYLNEAVLLLSEFRTAQAIDKTMRRFGMPMGPLELLDQVGLDVAAHIERSMRPFFNNRFAPNPLFERMQGRGWLGEKTKTGFYYYGGVGKRANVIAPALFHRPDVGGVKSSIRPENVYRVHAAEFQSRMVLVMVNEAAHCLSEGIAQDADAIDIAMVFGTGWAPHRGGPLHYADNVSIPEVVRILTELKQTHGPRFDPCEELRRRAENHEPFFPKETILASV